MKRFNTMLVAIGLIAVFSLMAQTAAIPLSYAAPANPAGAAHGKIPGQYIIVLKDGAQAGPNEVAAKAKEKGAEVLFVYEHALKGFAVRASEQALDGIKNNPNVDYIEQDQEVQIFAQALPTGINRADGDLSSTASGNRAGSVDVDIAIIDTGIQLNHPDLNVFMDVTFVKGKKSGNDDNGHGTHVAGIAAAKDNEIGVVGMAPDARLWAVKVLNRSGSGTISGVIMGINYVTQNAGEIEVANMSLGCECTSLALNSAIHNSVAAGVTYVVAAGNNGRDASTFSPANHPDVIAVSAIADSDGSCGEAGPATSYGADDTLASFSNFGSVVDMAAPGVSILSTYKGSAYAYMSGTSMASPHVAGAAALYMSANSAATPLDVKNALASAGSTPSTVCDGNGHGYFAGDVDGIAEPLLYARTL